MDYSIYKTNLLPITCPNKRISPQIRAMRHSLLCCNYYMQLRGARLIHSHILRTPESSVTIRCFYSIGERQGSIPPVTAHVKSNIQYFWILRKPCLTIPRVHSLWSHYPLRNSERLAPGRFRFRFRFVRWNTPLWYTYTGYGVYGV